MQRIGLFQHAEIKSRCPLDQGQRHLAGFIGTQYEFGLGQPLDDLAMAEHIARGRQRAVIGPPHDGHLPGLARDGDILGAGLVLQPPVVVAEDRAGQHADLEAVFLRRIEDVTLKPHPVALVQLFVLRSGIGVVEGVGLRLEDRRLIIDVLGPARVQPAHHVALVERVRAVKLVACLMRPVKPSVQPPGAPPRHAPQPGAVDIDRRQQRQLARGALPDREMHVAQFRAAARDRGKIALP
nr:hypothetical protein [Rhodovulum sp.]